MRRAPLSRLTALAVAVVVLAGCAEAFSSQRGGVVIDPWPQAAASLPDGARLPDGFRDELVVGGLAQPTAVRWLPNGDMLVSEQRGVLSVIAAGGSSSPAVLVDMRTQALNRFQDGLLGLAVDPDFPEQPYVYLAYTHDARLGGEAPLYGRPDENSDDCPGDRNDCPASARLSRFRLDGFAAGPEQVLVEGWCMSGRNHTIGTIAFAPDGSLYAGGGDGADGLNLDYGQLGVVPNTCADPGVVPDEPGTSEGGSLRSQDLRTTSDPTGLEGTIIRVDRATGEALPDNPGASAADANARRVIAYGLRNPFRFTFRPGSDELWIADVGWHRFEELNRLTDPVDGPVPNFGWPCYEGPERQGEFDALEVALCESLYEAEPAELTFPVASLARSDPRRGDCADGGVAISALSFYSGTTFPVDLHGALFFGDAQRRCMWVMTADEAGTPDPRTVREFMVGVAPVDAQTGPDGALYYVDYAAGEVRRIVYGPPGGGP